MSTTIDVYPTIPSLPIVEETRARAEQLFQELLDRHGIRTTITVKARWFPDSTERQPVLAPEDLRWAPGVACAFGYYLDGEVDSWFWPSCLAYEPDEYIGNDPIIGDDWLEDLDESWRGRLWHAADLREVLPEETLIAMERVKHCWYEYRNFAGPPVASGPPPLLGPLSMRVDFF